MGVDSAAIFLSSSLEYVPFYDYDEGHHCNLGRGMFWLYLTPYVSERKYVVLGKFAGLFVEHDIKDPCIVFVTLCVHVSHTFISTKENPVFHVLPCLLFVLFPVHSFFSSPVTFTDRIHFKSTDQIRIIRQTDHSRRYPLRKRTKKKNSPPKIKPPFCSDVKLFPPVH